MDRVVLHYRPGSALRLSTLLQQTQRLLEPPALRPPPAFRPWFPRGSAHRRPIRPAKPPPRIGPAGGVPTENQPGITDWMQDAPGRVQLVAPGTGPGTERDVPAVRRSWSVSRQSGVQVESRMSLSSRLRRLVSLHRLHLRQRAKWVITQQNCSDLEEAWRCLSRSVRRAGLPTCNANIQRERAEIWVFCDVLHCEQVGRHLKDELWLAGRIHLAVHRLGNIFSM
ncbi:shieldin complex subunit 3 [Poeciliopsis prolifica]|uniref:shieldin complex subunit 3 n=1 Tax=Poeciliopsis prolifica TaxID=188132 RepID=UPI002413AF01|nr:shieldin complex subunit 3 [Poeciliopsis prolifica]